MKKILLLLSLVFAIATSCEKEKSDTTPEGGSGETKEVSITATSKTTWHYYSAKENKVVGTGEDQTDDAAWAEKTNWDYAIMTSSVKTNSGSSTSKKTPAKGGLHTLKSDILFADATLSHIGTGMEPAIDVIVSVGQMDIGGIPQENIDISKSTAVVSIMKGMPPTWVKSPIYVFRSADGETYYKVEFTQYKDAANISGHVKFNIAEIY